MKYLVRLKATKGLPYELPKQPKAPYDSFDSIEGKRFPESVSLELKPYLEADGNLIIPFVSARRYWWWNGGQSSKETIEEVQGWKH